MRERFREQEKNVSAKAAVVVLWASLIAGAAVASENHRLCGVHAHELHALELHRQIDLDRLHNELQALEEADVLIITEVDVTN